MFAGEQAIQDGEKISRYGSVHDSVHGAEQDSSKGACGVRARFIPRKFGKPVVWLSTIRAVIPL